jgi:hypothetical protein
LGDNSRIREDFYKRTWPYGWNDHQPLRKFTASNQIKQCPSFSKLHLEASNQYFEDPKYLS